MVTPRPADSFVEMLGVNIHAGRGLPGSPLIDPDIAYLRHDIPRLVAWLGLRYVRDRASYTGQSQTRALAVDAALVAQGVKTLRFSGNTTSLATLLTAGYSQPLGVEAANEPDGSDPTGWYAASQTFQPTIYDAVKAQWPTVPVLTPSMQKFSTYATAGPVGDAYVDLNSCHIYTLPGMIAEDNTSADTKTTPADFAAWQTLAPGKPIWITEHGYPSGNPSDSSGVWIEERAAACALVMNLFYFMTDSSDTTRGALPYPTKRGGFGGVQRVFIYELLDQHRTTTTDQDRFGLFNYDGTPKASAMIVRNLVRLLADPGGTFTLTDLAVSVSSGSTDAIQYLLFQKRDGSYWLVFNARRTPVTIPYGDSAVTPRSGLLKVDRSSDAFTFALGQTFNYVTLYRPLMSDRPWRTLGTTSTAAVTATLDVQVLRLANIPPPTVSTTSRGGLTRGYYESRTAG